MLLESCTPRPLMLEALGVLRSHDLRTAALTNNFRSVRGDDVFSHAVSELRPLFDVVVESAVEGLRKPDPAFYQLACARLGVEPRRCIFLDDIGRNLKPAHALGMRTIRVDVADSSGGRALKVLAATLGGPVGRKLQGCLRLAKL